MNTNDWNIDAAPSEMYVIGAIMNDASLMDELTSVVNPQMFASHDMQELWSVASRLHSRGEPIDLMSLASAARNVVNRIGIEQLSDMKDTYISRHDAIGHASRISEMYFRSVIQSSARELQMQAVEPQVEIDELRGKIEQLSFLMDGMSYRSGLQYGEHEADVWYDSLEERMKNPASVYGIMSGWLDVDEHTLGFQRKEIIVVGGRTSVGKTAFAIEAAIRAHRRGNKVGIFSLEMSSEQVRNRIACNLAKLSLGQVRTGQITTDDFTKLMHFRDVIADIAIDDTRGVSTEYIIAEMKRVKRTRGLDFVIVDYLQEINERHEQNDNTGSALARVTRKLRQAAQQCDCSVMALSQLKREAEGKKPSVADLFGSSGIESAADVIMLLHRDKKETPKMLGLDIAKQRNGKTGEVNLYYDPVLQRIDGLRNEA